jgi:hypothetical protein
MNSINITMMKNHLSNWNGFLKKEVLPMVKGNDYWENHISAILKKDIHYGVHLAILVEPYLQYIIDGKKTVESRFSINRIAPYGHVSKGDIILLKKSSGPIIGICQISTVWYYRLDPSSWHEIKTSFSEMLCAQDPEFWKIRERASFASLMRLMHVYKISPIEFKKKDRRGWIVLKPSTSQQELFTK